MTTFPWEVVVLAAVLAINRLAVPATYFRPGAFWAIQAINAGLAIAVAVFGLPGLGEYASVGWLVAGLLAFHVFQNLAMRNAALLRREREDAERERLRKLRTLGEPDGPRSQAPTEPPAE